MLTKIEWIHQQLKKNGYTPSQIRRIRYRSVTTKTALFLCTHHETLLAARYTKDQLTQIAERSNSFNLLTLIVNNLSALQKLAYDPESICELCKFQDAKPILQAIINYGSTLTGYGYTKNDFLSMARTECAAQKIKTLTSVHSKLQACGYNQEQISRLIRGQYNKNALQGLWIYHEKFASFGYTPEQLLTIARQGRLKLVLEQHPRLTRLGISCADIIAQLRSGPVSISKNNLANLAKQQQDKTPIVNTPQQPKLNQTCQSSDTPCRASILASDPPEPPTLGPESLLENHSPQFQHSISPPLHAAWPTSLHLESTQPLSKPPNCSEKSSVIAVEEMDEPSANGSLEQVSTPSNLETTLPWLTNPDSFDEEGSNSLPSFWTNAFPSSPSRSFSQTLWETHDFSHSVLDCRPAYSSVWSEDEDEDEPAFKRPHW